MWLWSVHLPGAEAVVVSVGAVAGGGAGGVHDSAHHVAAVIAVVTVKQLKSGWFYSGGSHLVTKLIS